MPSKRRIYRGQLTVTLTAPVRGATLAEATAAFQDLNVAEIWQRSKFYSLDLVHVEPVEPGNDDAGVGHGIPLRYRMRQSGKDGGDAE